MVKSKKSASKKSKSEEISNTEVEAVDTLSDTQDNVTEEVSQENGVEDGSVKKKGKVKPKEKKEAEENDENATVENGDEIVEKKKSSSKPTKKETKTSKKPSKTPAEPARKSTRTPKPVSKEGGDEEAYEVEKLVDFRVYRGTTQYQVRWKGYSRGDDTWENEADLNCPELLQKFKADNPDVGKKAKKRSASKSPTKTPAAKKSNSKKVEEDYEVEEIVGIRIKNGKKEFKIRWKGYKPTDDSWEPEKHLSCQDLIQEYLEDHKDEVEAEEKKSSLKTPSKKAKRPKSAKGKKRKAK